MIYYVLFSTSLLVLYVYYVIKVTKNRKQRIVYFTFPSLDYFVIFNTAVGEEFVFRILPHLLIESYPMARMILSSIVFGVLHGLPLIRTSNEVDRIEIIFTVIFTTISGLMLVCIEKLFSSPVQWYITCCVIHVINNFAYIYNNNKNLIYNPGFTNTGFVMKK